VLLKRCKLWVIILAIIALPSWARAGGLPLPRIGRLVMPPVWWVITQDAARANKLDPYWIAAVMAIESRYYRFAINRKYQCFGLMQLQKDVCRIMGVSDPFDPGQNIRAGAAILGRLERRYRGDKRRILKKYNPTDTGAYSREVIKAWKQARRAKCLTPLKKLSVPDYR